MQPLTELDTRDSPAAVVGTRAAAIGETPSRVMVRNACAGNDETCEFPAIRAHDIEAWARHAFAANDLGEKPTMTGAAAVQRVVRQAHVVRADFLRGIIAAAVEALRAGLRRAQTRRRQRAQAKAICDALYGLDDHMLRDLGFTRDEVTSIAAEATGEAEITRVRTMTRRR